MIKKCTNCQKEFKTEKRNQKYCSVRCCGIGRRGLIFSKDTLFNKFLGSERACVENNSSVSLAQELSMKQEATSFT